MRLMVTGSRDWTNVAKLCAALSSVHEADVTLIHGDCEGADHLARDFARTQGWRVKAYPLELDRCGSPHAYHARNQAMVDSRPDVCFAFPMPRSSGTWDAVRRAKAAGVRVVVVR